MTEVQQKAPRATSSVSKVFQLAVVLCVLSQGAYLYFADNTIPTASMVYVTTSTESADPLQRKKYTRIPLMDLVNTASELTECRADRVLINITEHVESTTHRNRKIPKVIHMTGKTRCGVPAFTNNIDKWRFQDYSVYFHDDAAVDRFLLKDWPEFPYLQMILPCMISGAAKADLWRYLMLWEYGGIYTDIDNAPGPKFLNGSAIKAEDDSWFVVERLGIMSQYFMAASPRHPFMYLCVKQVLSGLLALPIVGKQYVPYVTGPGATKNAFIQFMRAQKTPEKYFRVGNGSYVGLLNRTVTVVGTKATGAQWVVRESVRGKDKQNGYAQMGMKHFSSKATKDKKIVESCHAHLYLLAAKDYELHANASRTGSN